MNLEGNPITLTDPEDQTPRTDRAARAIAEVGLPELEGTFAEAQKATEIRAAILVRADDVLTQIRSNEILTDAQEDTYVWPDFPVTDENVQQAQVALNRLRHVTDAAWWIAHENDPAARLLQHFLENEQP